MGIITKTVQHHIESFWQKQMRLDKVTQPRWGDEADHFHERDMKHGMAKLMVQDIV